MTAPHPAPRSLVLSATDTDSWDDTYKSAIGSLAAEDKEWLSKPENQEPFTSAQMITSIESHMKNYTKHRSQKVLSALDSILSHIGSFADVISVTVQANFTCAGLIWGSLYLVIQASEFS
jgi:hypothetical protein